MTNEATRKCIHAWFEDGYQGSTILMMRFTNREDARIEVREVWDKARVFGLPCKLHDHWDEPNRGVFETGLIFDPGISIAQCREVFFTLPPTSNRGVTKNE